MKKKLFFIFILPVIALVGFWLLRSAFATSNPHTWTNGLVGYWSFDGQYTTSTSGTRDVSGNNNWGTFNGGLKQGAGIVGQALKFDGVDDSVEVADSAILDVDYLTIEAWVRSASSTQDQAIVSKWSDSDFPADNRSFRLTLREPNTPVTTLKACLSLNDMGTTGAFGIVCSNTILNVAQWYHVVATYDGSYTKIYVNGVFENQTAYSNGIFKGAYPLRIGQRSTSTAAFFNGLIDEVRIYNRALSADEIKQHYDQTKRNFIISPGSGISTNGLVGYWNFDGQYTTSTSGTRDVSGNNNWGTFNGGVGMASGISGQALSLDGVNDYVDVGSGSSLTFTDKFTVTGWIKKTENFHNGYDLLVGRNAGGGNGWMVGIYSTGSKIIFGEAGWGNFFSRHIYSNVYNFQKNQWYYIAVSYDTVAKTADFYVNGNAIGLGLQSVDKVGITNIGSLWMGSFQSGASGIAYPWAGSLDEVRIYNRALSADEIKQHYDQTKRNFIVSPSSGISTNGLVGYWNFDGQYTTSTSGTRDVSGNNNWGTFNGGVGMASGVSGQALSLDGVNDYVDVGPDNIFNPGLGSITWEAWFKTSFSDSGTKSIIDFHTGSGWDSNGSVGLVINGSVKKLQAKAINNGNNESATVYSTGPVNNGNWHHSVLVWNFSTKTIQLYLDGVSQGSNTNINITTPPGAQSNRKLSIGATHYATGDIEFFNGLIDEIRIYNRALSADEVMQHYQQTRRNLTL